MKLAKLSLAAMVVAGLASSTFAASDTLADAFKNGKVNGELRAWYFDRDTGVATTGAQYSAANVGKQGHYDIFNTAVILGYVTDSFYGLSLGMTVQSNYAALADKEAKQMFGADSYGSGAVLSEAYVAYTLGKTTAKVGRQFISTPLVGGSGSRIVKESFEGATIVNTDLPQTTLIAGYVDKFQGRTTRAIDSSLVGADSEIPGFKKSAVIYGVGVASFDDAYTLGVINKSITNLTITGQYAFVGDVDGTTYGDTDIYYAGANYTLPVSNFKLGFDAAYQKSATETTSAYEGDMTALKASLIDLAGFGASFGYTTTSKNDAVILGMGNGSGAVAVTAPLIAGASKVSTADTDAYKLEVAYDFSKLGATGVKAMAQYIDINNDSATKTDMTYWAAQLSYDIPALKGLTLSAEYEDAKTKTTSTVDSSEFRFRANYKF